MSTEVHTNGAAGRRSGSLSAPSGKATAAPPKLTQQEDAVELKNMASGADSIKTPLPIEQDIMQLARLGEVAAVQKLFESKQFDAKYRDEEGITPLHVCSFLSCISAIIRAT